MEVKNIFYYDTKQNKFQWLLQQRSLGHVTKNAMESKRELRDKWTYLEWAIYKLKF